MILTDPEDQFLGYIAARADAMREDAEECTEMPEVAKALRNWADSWEKLAKSYRRWRLDPNAEPKFAM